MDMAHHPHLSTEAAASMPLKGPLFPLAPTLSFGPTSQM